MKEFEDFMVAVIANEGEPTVASVTLVELCFPRPPSLPTLS